MHSPDARKRFYPYKVPAKGHPFVRRLFEELNRQQVSIRDLSEKSGVAVVSIRQWRTAFSPRLTNIEACLRVLGLNLKIE